MLNETSTTMSTKKRVGLYFVIAAIFLIAVGHFSLNSKSVYSYLSMSEPEKKVSSISGLSIHESPIWVSKPKKHSRPSTKIKKDPSLAKTLADPHLPIIKISNGSNVSRPCFYFKEGNIYHPVLLPKETLKEKNCNRRLPSAVIIGVRNCGTSALEFFLRSHPDVVFSVPEEMHYFGAPKSIKHDITWYRQQMMYSKTNQTTIEKTPKYFVREEAPSLIAKELGKNTKLILLLHDPVKRAMADYLQLKVAWPKKNFMFEHRWDSFDGKLNDYYYKFNSTSFEATVINSTANELDPMNAIIYLGQYATFLRRWLKVFPVKQMHLINTEDLITDPARVLQRLEKFLRLSPYFDESKVYFDGKRNAYCLGSPFHLCVDDSQGLVHPHIDEVVFTKLRSYYRRFNDDLCRLYSRACFFNWVKL